jgi:hypothetical protein
MRYFTDRTFLICLYVATIAALLCAFGRIDSTAFALVASAVITGWITKRTAEKIQEPDLIRATKEVSTNASISNES